MKEIKILIRSHPADHLRGQPVVLGEELGQVFFTERVIIRGLSHNGLHRDLLETQVRNVQNVLGEIQVISGKGSPCVISLLPSGLRQSLEFGDNPVVGILSAAEGAHLIVDFLPAVNRENDIAHLPVKEVLNLII